MTFFLWNKIVFICPYNGSQWAPMLFGSQHFSKYLFIVCVRKSNRFGTMWGWTNDHRTFIFGI